MSETNTVSPLRQRMIEDMAARKLNPHTQRSHISSCKRFAAWLKRSPDTATPDEVRRFCERALNSPQLWASNFPQFHRGA
jgi:integrase/recombinase XerD